MKRVLALLLASLLLASCAATGPRFSDRPADAPAVAPGEARLIVFRLNVVPQYSIRSARLEVDRTLAGDLLPAGFRVLDVAPGPHTLAADMWDAPGRCEVNVEVTGGGTYYFEVAPRLPAWVSGVGAVAAPSTPWGGLAGAVLSLGGMVAESSGKACGGAFSIVAIEPAAAVEKLSGLRVSQ